MTYGIRIETITSRHGEEIKVHFVGQSSILVFGSIPMDMFSKLTRLVPKDAVADPDLARMAQANFAFGLPDDLAQLREQYAPLAKARESRKHEGLSEALINWLATGQRGTSSNTIVSHLTSYNANSKGFGHDHPHDPADLIRCRRLLEACPELAARFHLMRNVSPVWSALVDNWEDLCTCLDTELPHWRTGGGSAPATYKAMKSIIENAK